MDFIFSKREMARQAAREASLRWYADAPDSFTSDGSRIEYWSYVVNASLAAIPDPEDQVGTRRAYAALAKRAGS